MRRLVSAGLLISAMAGCAGTTHPSAGTVTPAPGGTRSQVSGAVLADSAGPRHTPADVRFMSGMIGHHAQAVLMAGWAPSHGASPAVRSLCERIVVSQRDEIALMQRWLREWHEPVPQADASHDMMPGMDPSMLMPGMLTADELIQLDQSAGPEFDRLFLTFMIRHHQGALTMVQQLITTTGAARDDNVFKLVSDMNADQTIEIDRMRGMLTAIAIGATSP
jgi:uncharacterized protein (DUF305 family)